MYLYFRSNVHHFPSNKTLFDKHKGWNDLRFYNCTYPDGNPMIYFGPNDSQSEDYICKLFCEQSPVFKLIIRTVKTKLSDRGFGRTIEGREWSLKEKLNVWTAYDANKVPWNSMEVRDNRLFAALRAPVEQFHTYTRIFELFNNFPIT